MPDGRTERVVSSAVFFVDCHFRLDSRGVHRVTRRRYQTPAGSLFLTSTANQFDLFTVTVRLRPNWDARGIGPSRSLTLYAACDNFVLSRLFLGRVARQNLRGPDHWATFWVIFLPSETCSETYCSKRLLFLFRSETGYCVRAVMASQGILPKKTKRPPLRTTLWNSFVFPGVLTSYE